MLPSDLTRDRYLHWAKVRALLTLEDCGVEDAVRTIIRLLDQRADTKLDANDVLRTVGAAVIGSRSAEQARHYIQGFE